MDSSGSLACCPHGTTCSGNVGAVAGQYTKQVQQTQVVYQTVSQNNCGCDETSTTPVVNVLPVVPLTTSTSPTFPPTITTTTTPLAGAAVLTNNACPNGYSTILNANVGQPTRVVGCYVIIDSGAERSSNLRSGIVFLTMLWALWIS